MLHDATPQRLPVSCLTQACPRPRAQPLTPGLWETLDTSVSPGEVMVGSAQLCPAVQELLAASGRAGALLWVLAASWL